jgi:hypothetical protein
LPTPRLKATFVAVESIVHLISFVLTSQVAIAQTPHLMTRFAQRTLDILNGPVAQGILIME